MSGVQFLFWYYNQGDMKYTPVTSEGSLWHMPKGLLQPPILTWARYCRILVQHIWNVLLVQNEEDCNEQRWCGGKPGSSVDTIEEVSEGRQLRQVALKQWRLEGGRTDLLLAVALLRLAEVHECLTRGGLKLQTHELVLRRWHYDPERGASCWRSYVTPHSQLSTNKRQSQANLSVIFMDMRTC